MHTIKPHCYYNTERSRCTNTTRAVVTPPSSVKIPRIAAEDPELQSTWAHRAWLAAGSTSVAVPLGKAVIGTADSGNFIQPVVAAAVGYILADLGSGLYHWGIDNYGDASTPMFGSQINAFRGHHRWPWMITKRQFANNLHALARAVMIAVIPINILTDDAVVQAFVGVCAGCIMFSQQFHAWSHSTKSKLPPAVVALQDAGILLPRQMHMAHHRPPYNDNYCIVSGVWNEFLNRHNVFEALELAVFIRSGVRPRSWNEPDTNWSEELGVEPG